MAGTRTPPPSWGLWFRSHKQSHTEPARETSRMDAQWASVPPPVPFNSVSSHLMGSTSNCWNLNHTRDSSCKRVYKIKTLDFWCLNNTLLEGFWNRRCEILFSTLAAYNPLIYVKFLFDFLIPLHPRQAISKSRISYSYMTFLWGKIFTARLNLKMKALFSYIFYLPWLKKHSLHN